MYLQDFTKIGGVFVPSKVLHTSRKSVSMRGQLHLQGEVFHIKILAKKGQYLKITKVCGKTAKESISCKERLLHIYSEALKNNAYGLRTYVQTRQRRKLTWSLITLLDFLCIILSVVNLYKHGPLLSLVTACIISILLFVLCIKCKMPMLHGK